MRDVTVSDTRDKMYVVLSVVGKGLLLGKYTFIGFELVY